MSFTQEAKTRIDEYVQFLTVAFDNEQQSAMKLGTHAQHYFQPVDVCYRGHYASVYLQSNPQDVLFRIDTTLNVYSRYGKRYQFNLNDAWMTRKIKNYDEKQVYPSLAEDYCEDPYNYERYIGGSFIASFRAIAWRFTKKQIDDILSTLEPPRV